MEKIYNLPDAAEYLGLKQQAVGRYAREGRLASTRNRYGYYEFTKEQLDAFAAVPRPTGRPPYKNIEVK
jgi:predicted site-specific integrase-resolvase